MEYMSEVDSRYNCNVCNKIYSSYQSLWIHNKKYHQLIIKNDIEPVKNVKH
jgi:hypothetical protein